MNIIINTLFLGFTLIVLLYVWTKWELNIMFKYISTDERECRKCGGHHKRRKIGKYEFWSESMPPSVVQNCYCKRYVDAEYTVKQKCEACNGTGECVTSCCTGEVILGEYHICPKCHESIALSTCIYCDGTGDVVMNSLADKQNIVKTDVSLLVDRMMDLEV